VRGFVAEYLARAESNPDASAGTARNAPQPRATPSRVTSFDDCLRDWKNAEADAQANIHGALALFSAKSDSGVERETLRAGSQLAAGRLGTREPRGGRVNPRARGLAFNGSASIQGSIGSSSTKTSAYVIATVADPRLGVANANKPLVIEIGTNVLF
jgi:hypothetical protein